MGIENVHNTVKPNIVGAKIDVKLRRVEV